VTQFAQGYNVALTAVLGNAGTNRFTQDGILFQDSHVPIAQVTDGTSNTLMVGERPPSNDMIFGWWFAGAGYGTNSTIPYDPQVGVGDVTLGTKDPAYSTFLIQSYNFPCSPAKVGLVPGVLTDNCDQTHYWSLHFGGSNFLFADGSAKFLPYSANSVLPALGTRSGGEVSADY
jgi:prepilin-type processing-associated H-X9-DG protein